jgi:hypothetical protein
LLLLSCYATYVEDVILHLAGESNYEEQ